MSIPPFDDNGYLPPGIHPATLQEMEQRFGGGSELRRVQMQSIGWLVDLARRAGVRRLVINGSFVTEVMGIKDEVDLKNTKEKLARIQAAYESARKRPVTNPETRTLTLRSLKATINQFMEEIARYEAHAGSRK